MPDYSAKMGDPEGRRPNRDPANNVGPAMKRPIDPKRVLQILECKRKVLSFVESMLEPEVTLDELTAGEELICRLDYDSIAQERQLLKLCGYPLCPNKLIKVWNQKYHVSLRDKKVYDVEIRKLYCSVRCMETSMKYRDEHVPEQPVWMRLEDIKMGYDNVDAPTAREEPKQ